MEHKIDFLKLPGRIGSAMTNNRNNFENYILVMCIYGRKGMVEITCKAWLQK